MDQMIPHHVNAVNMARIALKLAVGAEVIFALDCLEADRSKNNQGNYCACTIETNRLICFVHC